jgi:hypothetical protein
MDIPESPVKFEDDDEGYLDWLRRFPRGHVLNANRPPTASYVMLHRSSCHTINGEPTRGEGWTTTTIKVCAIRSAQLKQWAMDEVGGIPTRCGFCTPSL